LKICWDELEDLFLTKKGNLMRHNEVYVEKECCKFCGETYLTSRRSPSDFCCRSCSKSGQNNPFYGKKHTDSYKSKMSNIHKGKIVSETTRKKLSEAHSGDNHFNYGKHHSEETKAKMSINNYNSKGGVRKLNLPLYDTYFERLAYAEELRLYIDEEGRRLLEVVCSKCGAWFVPKDYSVRQRIRCLNGRDGGESRFYCSQICIDNCEIYRKNPNDFLVINNNNDKLYTDYELSIWSKEVLKRANYKCEYCGTDAKHAHHIEPKKLVPGLALDPENGLACCIECHYKYGHKDNCLINKIREENLKCLN